MGSSLGNYAKCSRIIMGSIPGQCFWQHSHKILISDISRPVTIHNNNNNKINSITIIMEIHLGVS